MTKSGCTARLGPEGSYRIYNLRGKARKSHDPDQRRGLPDSATSDNASWWLTSTDWHHIWGLLGTSSVEEGAM
jgi:hypothetical protein